MSRRKYGCGSLLKMPQYGTTNIENYVPPRINQETGKKENHIPLGNYAGPGTDIQRRLREGVRATTATDKAAQKHDIHFFNIRELLQDGDIDDKEAMKLVREADNVLIREAAKNISINPLNAAHSAAVTVGIKLKRWAEDKKFIDRLKFLGIQEDKTKTPLKHLRRSYHVS